RHVVAGRLDLLHRLAVWAEAGRQRPAALPLQRLQADPGGDAVQPGAGRRAAGEVAVPAPGVEVRLLDQVLGLVDGSDEPVAVRDQLLAEAAGVPDELVAVPVCGVALLLPRR